MLEAGGTVARIAGVQGIHRARPDTPRAQDFGFGYLVASVVDTLSAGRAFTVWDSPEINRLATPVLATDAAELIWRALDARPRASCTASAPSTSTGCHWHAARWTRSTSNPIGRRSARRPSHRRERIPYDTRLDATRTAERLDVDAAGRGRAAERAGMGFDVITMGRISVDVYPQQVGVSLREVESFGKFLGGSLDQRRRRGGALRTRAWPRSRAPVATRSASSSTTRSRALGWTTAG